MLMIKLACNNIKNTSTGHMFFKLNSTYHLYIFFKNKVDLKLKSCLANKVVKELENLISIYL